MATQRGYYREELLRAKDALEKALIHLARVRDAYQRAHPEISNYVQQVGDGLVACADLIQSIHDSI